jgi:hypothetical protein
MLLMTYVDQWSDTVLVVSLVPHVGGVLIIKIAKWNPVAA